MICKCCGKKCGVQVIDEGIGPYEYWGARAVDTDYVVYSDCCQDDIIDEDGSNYTQSELMRIAEKQMYDDFYPYDEDRW